MALDFGKCFKAALIPTVVLVVLGIFQQVVGMIPILNFLVCLAGPLFFLIMLVVLAWAGFSAAKAGMDLVGGAITGAIAGVISAIINGIVGLVLNMLGIGVGAALGNDDLGGAAIGAGIGIVGSIIGIVLGVFIGLAVGAVMGAIGAFVAGMKK